MFARRLLCITAGIVLPCCALAAPEFSYNGFGSIGLGRVLTKSPGNPGGVLGAGNPPAVDSTIDDGQCPCAIADWVHAGVYDTEWSIRPDTVLGLQGRMNVDDKLSLTAQMTNHISKNDAGADLQWLFASYDLNSSWTLQAGRKRLPLYAYSDYMDVGYAYPWLRPPQDLYGWQIVNYNGANVMYRNTFGDYGVTWNTWAGSETDKDNVLLNKFYYFDTVKESWDNIVGTYVDVNGDWWQARVIYMRNIVDRTVGETQKTPSEQHIYGVALSVDRDNVVLRSEFNKFIRPGAEDYYESSLIGVGYRIGNFLPMFTHSYFKENFKPSPADMNEVHYTNSVSLSWDFRSNMAAKVQYDDFTDHSHWPFVGNTKTIAFALDFVF